MKTRIVSKTHAVTGPMTSVWGIANMICCTLYPARRAPSHCPCNALLSAARKAGSLGSIPGSLRAQQEQHRPGLMPGPEMNAGLDAEPVQPRAVAVVMPGPCFGEKFATNGRMACFSYALALSIELAYIDCIFLPIHI